MKLAEAYSLLGIPETSTPEEAKKAYRSLTKKFHPDINKDPGAEDKFKQINEAYARVTSGEPDRNDFSQGMPFDMSDIFSSMGINFGRPQKQNKVHPEKPISLTKTISFKESVLGVKKDISFERNIKCENCNGNGTYNENKCKECNDTGFKTQIKGNTIFRQQCSCNQNAKSLSKCTKCKNGVNKANVSIKVNIPAGIESNQTLRLQNMGNFITNQHNDYYSDVFLTINVTPQSNLQLHDMDVICDLDISLLEALKGTTKEVDTINGKQNINVPKLSKNKDTITLKSLGVASQGNQVITLNIKYPEDVTKLIEVLNG